MNKLIRIRRQENKDSLPYYEEFGYEVDDREARVSTMLLELSRPGVRNKAGEQTRPVSWEHSCHQKRCGGCSMIINGTPRLACDTRLADLKGDVITLEPLRKFPVVCDLFVDRSAVFERYRELSLYLEEETAYDGYDDETVTEAAFCLQCGLCLEICPNYHLDGEFLGMSGMTEMAGLLVQAEGEQAGELKKTYRRDVYEGCGKSLSCRDICPAGLDMEMLLAKSNRRAWKRRSLWKRKKRH